MEGRWYSTGGGGTRLPGGLIAAALLIAAMAGVASAVAELVVWLLVTVMAVAVLLAVAAALGAARRYRHPGRESRFHLVPRPVVIRPPVPAVEAKPERAALEQPRELHQHWHTHFHGVDEDRVAELLRCQGPVNPAP